MRYLNTVYVRDHRAHVKHRRGSLLVSSPEGDQRVPLEAIDSVVMLGGGQVTSQALEACVRRGVRVSALRMGGSVRFIVGGAAGGNVHLRTAQYRAVMDDAHSLALSKSIVAAKLQNSRKVVDRWARDEKDPGASDQLATRAQQIMDRIPRLADAEDPRPRAWDRGRCRQNLLWRGRSGRSERQSWILREESGDRRAIRSTPCSGFVTA